MLNSQTKETGLKDMEIIRFLENGLPQARDWNEDKEICGNHIQAGFLNVIIQDIVVHGTND